MAILGPKFSGKSALIKKICSNKKSKGVQIVDEIEFKLNENDAKILITECNYDIRNITAGFVKEQAAFYIFFDANKSDSLE